MVTTRPSHTSQDKNSSKIRKGDTPRIKRDNDRDDSHNVATHQESRDRNAHEHFHAANQRPEDQYDAPIDEVNHRYLSDERNRRWREDDGRGDIRDNADHYDGNRAERDRYELNDRQNGWQANTRIDNRTDDRSLRDDGPYRSDWRDRQWRETAHADRPSHDWRPNDDGRNEQRNGSEYDRDRGSYGNSRFRDDDHGYRTSRHDDRDYSRYEEQNDPRQPRHYSATSERDFEDRNPSQEWRRDWQHTGRGRHR